MMNSAFMSENELSYIIRGAIFKVYNTLGPGLLESVYELTLSYELKKAGLDVKCQCPLPVVYNDIKLDGEYRIDILVNNLVLIEIKSIENLAEVHHKQVLTYLKLSRLKLGLLVNFNSADITNQFSEKRMAYNFPTDIIPADNADYRRKPVMICVICGNFLKLLIPIIR